MNIAKSKLFKKLFAGAFAFLAIAIGLWWHQNSTTATEVASVDDFESQITNGRPTYIRFFANT